MSQLLLLLPAAVCRRSLGERAEKVARMQRVSQNANNQGLVGDGRGTDSGGYNLYFERFEGQVRGAGHPMSLHGSSRPGVGSCITAYLFTTRRW